MTIKKVGYRFQKIANLTGKLLQNYKQLEGEIFMILLKHVSGHLLVLFQFALLHLSVLKNKTNVTINSLHV